MPLPGPILARRAAGAVAGAAAWNALCRRYYGARLDLGHDEVHFARTDDGWRLALSRYEPAAGARDGRSPALLVHGLAASRIGFDVDPTVSLARDLAARGFDVWALELRGHGQSDHPGPFTQRRFGWSFDDYLLRDVPAALALVRRETGRPRVHWIGHSMGGLLLYAHLARGGSADLQSGVAIGSSLAYAGTPSDFHALARYRALAGVLPAVPLGPLATSTAPLAGRVPNRLEEFNVWPANVDGRLVRRLHATGFHPVSAPVLRQLATAMEPGGLRSADGSRRYMDGLGDARTPVLALAGDRDRQCHAEAAGRPLEALPAGTPSELHVLGRAGGQPEHYGHFDLLIGRRAPSEVFPRVAAWLERHEG